MSLTSLYADKPDIYYGTPRTDIIDDLSGQSGLVILELGCGDGATGHLALQRGVATQYTGIEMDSRSVAVARTRLTQVLEGTVESIDLAPMRDSADVLIISEVLEHIIDPWAVLRTMVECLKPGGTLYCSSPNVSHIGIIRNLISGRFEYTETGVMDRSHLRWFTPASYRALVESAGVTVERIGPVAPVRPKVKLFNRLTGNRFAERFWSQVNVKGRRTR